MVSNVTPDRWNEIAQLVHSARSGSEEAFRDLLDRHRHAITSTLFACGVRCEETAKDLVQDVVLRAWTRLDNLSDPRAFPAWIRRIAANTARDHLRRSAVRKEDSLETAVAVESDDDPHEKAERIAEIRLMLAAIEEEDPETVDLLNARAEGIPISELAQKAGITEAAMKMRLMRTRKRLRKRLETMRRG